MRRLGAKFPSQIAAEAISTEQLLEEKEKSLTEAATKNEELDKKNSLLQEKVDRLEKELDFVSKDRYELVRQTCTLQNRLGDFQSWPQFREDYDRLVTEYGMMQRQRAREDISHQQILAVAKEARLELATAKLAAAMSKIDHSEELNQLKRERDDARENYETLVSSTKTAAAAAATASNAATATATTTTTTTKGNTPGDKVLQEENTRLSLELRSQTSLLAKKTSEFNRMQSLLKSRSNHSASQLNEAASTIRSLEEEKTKGNKRIAELEKDLTEAKANAEQMEDMYMSLAFADPKKAGEEEEEDVKAEEEKGEEEDEEGEEGEEDEEGEDGSGEQPPTSWLLRQVVAMSKAGGPSGAKDKSGKSDDDDDDDDNNEGDDEDGEGGGNKEEEEEGEEEGDGGKGKAKGKEEKDEDEDDEEKRIHDENEDLFKDMMG